MKRFPGWLWLIICLFSLVSQALAKDKVVIVSKCLLSKNYVYEELAQINDLRLIKVHTLIGLQNEVGRAPRRCGSFLNVTQAYEAKKVKNNKQFLRTYLSQSHLSNLLAQNARIQYQKQIHVLYNAINDQEIDANLAKLTDFSDRNMYSEGGKESAQWLKTYLNGLVTQSPQNVSIVQLFTPRAKQPSLILKIGKALDAPAIVIGAHMDTLKGGHFSGRPGADENGSGVVTLLEVARILLKSELHFKKPIYLIWYAGGEEGKLGSQQVVQYFNKHQIAVDAVMQLDMTGYVGKYGPGIGLTDNFTDAALNVFLADIITTYVKLPIGAVRCGYACSDHFVWYQNGNRVVYPFETMEDEGNPYAHTSSDTKNYLSMVQMTNFVKLGLAFAVELAEPV